MKNRRVGNVSEKDHQSFVPGLHENQGSCVDTALNYARRGWLVFPIHTATDGVCSCGRSTCSRVGKHPRTLHGLRDATRDEDIIRRWWCDGSAWNIGVQTGAHSGIVVIDVDPGHGGDSSIAEYRRRSIGRLGKTVVSRTGGGGVHLFYKHPGPPVPNRTGVMPGVDVRGDGGYVLLPPSRHASGQRYEWVCPPESTPLAPLPDSLLSIVMGSSSPPRSHRQAHHGQREQPLKPSLSAIEWHGVPEGMRNDSLARLVGRWITQGNSEAGIMQKALAWSRMCQPPLPPEEATRVVRSIVRRAASRRSLEAEALNLMRGRHLFAKSRLVLIGLIGLWRELRSTDLVIVASYRMISRYSGVPISWMQRALQPLQDAGYINVRKKRTRGYEVTNVTFVNELAKLLMQKGVEEPVPPSERNL